MTSSILDDLVDLLQQRGASPPSVILMMIRPAKPEDAESIARVHVESWRAAYRGLMAGSFLDGLDVQDRAQRWLPFLADHAWPVLVLENDGDVLGFCHSTPSRDPDSDPRRTAEIASLYLHSTIWRQGHGRLLTKRVLADLRRRQYLEVTVWVLEGNQPARLFYESMSFNHDGVEKIDQRDGFSELRYRKTLE